MTRRTMQIVLNRISNDRYGWEWSILFREASTGKYCGKFDNCWLYAKRASALAAARRWVKEFQQGIGNNV